MARNVAQSRSVALSNRAILILVSALFLAPSALFAVGLRPLPGALVLAGCIGSLALIAQRQTTGESSFLAIPVDRRRLALCVVLASVILAFGGELHLFFATYDWRIRDAVLADLTRGGFPVGYDVQGAGYLLRAPLGMYMVPAAVGHVFGLMGAHVALVTQNAIILGSIFYLLMSLGGGWPHLVILILFGGLSLVGACFAYASAPGYRMDRLLNFSLDAWNPYFQYSSSIVQFFWAPNHTMPAWWLATLLLLQAKSEVDVATLGVSLAGAIFWSPLAVIPILIWLLYLAGTDWRRHLLAWRTWIGVGLGACFLPIAILMMIGSSEIARGVTAENPSFLPLYLLFIVLQLPSALFVFLNRRLLSTPLFALFCVNAVILLALPLFNFGPSNDFVMRGSIASLVVVAFAFGLLLSNPELSRKAKIAGYALVLLGSASAIVEFSRNIAFPRYDVSDCSLMESYYALGGVSVPTNYAVGNAQIPDWLMDAKVSEPLVAKPRRCWTDGFRQSPR
jgi:hypothetical protein